MFFDKKHVSEDELTKNLAFVLKKAAKSSKVAENVAYDMMALYLKKLVLSSGHGLTLRNILKTFITKTGKHRFHDIKTTSDFHWTCNTVCAVVLKILDAKVLRSEEEKLQLLRVKNDVLKKIIDDCLVYDANVVAALLASIFEDEKFNILDLGRTYSQVSIALPKSPSANLSMAVRWCNNTNNCTYFNFNGTCKFAFSKRCTFRSHFCFICGSTSHGMIDCGKHPKNLFKNRRRSMNKPRNFQQNYGQQNWNQFGNGRGRGRGKPQYFN